MMHSRLQPSVGRIMHKGENISLYDQTPKIQLKVVFLEGNRDLAPWLLSRVLINKKNHNRLFMRSMRDAQRFIEIFR
jgi:hypothetical protein